MYTHIRVWLKALLSFVWYAFDVVYLTYAGNSSSSFNVRESLLSFFSYETNLILVKLLQQTLTELLHMTKIHTT